MSRSTKPNLPKELATLRCLVGFLGQKNLAGWWDCQFLDATGFRFLETTFPRTYRTAALRSTTEAAGLVHDAAMGRSGTYHLFRLPPDIEDRVEASLSEADWTALAPFIASRESALAALQKVAEVLIQVDKGPVQVGVERKILSVTSLRELAAHYHAAFTQGIQCYPYFLADPG